MSGVDVYARQGFGGALRLAPPYGLLLIDFVNGFADPEAFGGGNIGPAIARSVDLLAFARQAGWPVAHSRIVFADDGANANIFAEKVPSLLALTEDSRGSQIVDALTPAPGEYVVRKTVPSAFFGTDLAAWYMARQIRTLVVAGCVTSGCVRASVVDAMCHGLRPVVVEDCVGDRAIAPHEANLFDMRQKNAEVMSLDDLLQVTAS
ncbi:isochorismatase family protein [Sphingobium sp. Sx8-8]|uniref:isochorismatase family protein n=1 Tax=Sphingobium sp. Sx8-8 TaxID=2933617 RepID=UPI001F5A9086